MAFANLLVLMQLGFRLASVFVGTLLFCLPSGALATRRLVRADPAELF